MRAHGHAEWKYWVGSVRKSRRRLEGFFQQLVAFKMDSAEAQLTDLQPVLADIERLVPLASKIDDVGSVGSFGSTWS